MRKVIFRNFQSPGDIVTLTATVRDLHKCYPRQFVTDVRTPCPGLWENNPYLTKLDEKGKDVQVIECQYPLVHRSNQTPVHFLSGFTDFLNDKLGLHIRPTEFKGDIHISPLEKTWHSQMHDLLGEDVPYWIIVAGGKRDFTIKWWSQERFQQVVDYFAGKILFVQVGDKNHEHRDLRGLIDLRGKTDLRQLVRLVYHAQGVLCPVTLAMHLAAAVPVKKGATKGASNRPCVVVAGGREPVTWEQYPGHQFLHTIGALPCCATGGCWKSRTVPLGDGDKKDQRDSLCADVVNGLPHCMDLIKPDDVIRAIKLYFDGGACEYFDYELPGDLQEASGADLGRAALEGVLPGAPLPEPAAKDECAAGQSTPPPAGSHRQTVRPPDPPPSPVRQARTMYIAASPTFEAGHKIGDMIVMAHAARLMLQNEPHDRVLLSLNPKHPLNFVFDAFIKDFAVEVVWDDWGIIPQAHCNRLFDERRASRMVRGIPFDTYKELYLRIHGGMRQGVLCGTEKGLGRKNIFEYYFFGQESSPPVCQDSVNFGQESFGYEWRAEKPPMSVLVAPHAFSQGNSVFTMEFWKSVVAKLLDEGVSVTAVTSEQNLFARHPNLSLKFFPGNLGGLFEEVRRQRLVLCGNTGIGWIAGSHGVPLIAGEPPFFWYMDYRYREAGVRSLVDIFSEPNTQHVVSLVLNFLRRNGC